MKYFTDAGTGTPEMKYNAHIYRKKRPPIWLIQNPNNALIPTNTSLRLLNVEIGLW